MYVCQNTAKNEIGGTTAPAYLLAGSALVRAAAVVCIGAPLVLCFTAGVTVLIRRCTHTQVVPPLS